RGGGGGPAVAPRAGQAGGARTAAAPDQPSAPASGGAVTAAAPGGQPAASANDIRRWLTPSFAGRPLAFEQNVGQTDRQVNFLARRSDYTLFLTPGEAVLALDATPAQGDGGKVAGRAQSVLRLQLVGASAQ